jgi:hypothetical protein
MCKPRSNPNLSDLDLELPSYTPDEVWALVDRIPNGPTTHWDTFSKGILGSVQNLLLPDHPDAAYGIARAWAERGPKFTEKGFEAAWKARLKDPWRSASIDTLRALAAEAAVGDGEGDGETRAKWDALRQACGVIAGKLRARWAEQQSAQAVKERRLLKSAVTGMPIVGKCAAIYALGWSLDRVVLRFLEGTGANLGDFDLTRLEGGGHRFARAEDAEMFEACHAEEAQLDVVTTSESGTRGRGEEWPTVRQWLTELQQSRAS